MCIILVIIAQAAHKDNVYDGHNYYYTRNAAHHNKIFLYIALLHIYR